MTPSIHLYGYATSPFVNKVATFLKYKALPYSFVHVRPVTNEAIKFTGQTQVPVLRIDGEWRKDSSPLGHWLDERFPERPLLPEDAAAQAHVEEVDAWVSDSLIPSRFRMTVDWQDAWPSIRRGWRLAEIVHSGTPLPLHWRVLWPFGVRAAPFIRRMVNRLDRSEPLDAMGRRLMDELEAHLAEGPFLASQSQVTIADLSAYVTLIMAWMIGIEESPWYQGRPALLAWMARVQATLPDNPLAVADRFVVHSPTTFVAPEPSPPAGLQTDAM